MTLVCPGHCGGTGVLTCGAPCPVCNSQGERRTGNCLGAVTIIGEAFPGLFLGLVDGWDDNPFMEEPEEDE